MGRQAPPISLLSRKKSGKDMGFADYLSKNPLEEPLPPSDKDENVVINTIEDFKLALLGNNLA